ncbi:hypothetical protein [Achromobacter xylosoxidans]|uniref:hypothetical protein n=1 Tax=Alcaligenes xylosoxydans xylosoxydans TaxID=85698 RepID=UPI0011785ACF|nr:hypothetical protein [Achromobacter xylosoxidans]
MIPKISKTRKTPGLLPAFPPASRRAFKFYFWERFFIRSFSELVITFSCDAATERHSDAGIQLAMAREFPKKVSDYIFS